MTEMLSEKADVDEDDEEDDDVVAVVEETKGGADVPDLGCGWVLAILIVCATVAYVLVYGYFGR